MRRGAAIFAALVVFAAVLAGCGGSSTPKATSGTAPITPGSKQPVGSSSGPAVAHVAGTPIAKASYEHWLAVERALGVGGNLGHRALAFLLTSSWVLGEASDHHISVSQAEVHRRLAELEHRSFPKAGQLQHFLASSGESTADLLARVKVELLASRISRLLAGKKLRSFHDHWKSLTSCLPAYVMEDCKQYRGSGEPQLSSPPKASTKAASSNGEVYSKPGAFSISSTAFERNGEIPAKYTCDGAGISPPLSWQKVPAHAAELVLFAIDDSAAGSNGGIRWIVGGIDPSSTGVAEGKLPQGAIVGLNTAGKATYSPVCPAPGHTDTIEFVLYALKKPISLSPGFQPAIAEHEYGSSKDLLGEAAITYAVYHRP
jgi:phosphatidylethanolamine-binding protein (PEBP) family uncharacterized protein